eukprot:scaffold353_cov185-Amphora_coffeaeformis.AAC.63
MKISYLHSFAAREAQRSSRGDECRMSSSRHVGGRCGLEILLMVESAYVITHDARDRQYVLYSTVVGGRTYRKKDIR